MEGDPEGKEPQGDGEEGEPKERSWMVLEGTVWWMTGKGGRAERPQGKEARKALDEMKGKQESQGHGGKRKRKRGKHGECVRRRVTEAEGRSKAKAGEPEGEDMNPREGGTGIEAQGRTKGSRSRAAR